MGQHITHNERDVLLAVLNNFFQDATAGENRINQPVWSNCINDSETPSKLRGKALSGVVSSLVQKGLLYSDDQGRDACVALTREGYALATEHVEPQAA